MPSRNDAPLPHSAPRWSHFREDVGILLWASFLAACVGTMFFFAYFDPLLLARDDAPSAWLADRKTAYAIGFFFFWAICTVASFLTAYLIDTRSDADEDAS